MNNHIYSIFPNESFVDLSLYQYGWQECKPLYSYGPYIRNHYLFHYVISGKGTLYSRNSSDEETAYNITAGNGFLICPGQVHTYIADKDDPWEYTWIEFDGIKAREFLRAGGLSIDCPIYKPLNGDLGNRIKEELLYIVNNKDASPLNLIGHLYLFLDTLVLSSITKGTLRGGKLKDFYIREAISFVEQHYQENITVEDIANACNLNRTYFGKIFKDAMGSSPQDFLIQFRMTKATDLMKITTNSIGKISEMVGYENQLHFSRAFKKFYGVCPREWRQNGYHLSDSKTK